MAAIAQNARSYPMPEPLLSRIESKDPPLLRPFGVFPPNLNMCTVSVSLETQRRVLARLKESE